VVAANTVPAAQDSCAAPIGKTEASETEAA